jgi:hypothetical protein
VRACIRFLVLIVGAILFLPAILVGAVVLVVCAAVGLMRGAQHEVPSR